MLLPLSLMHDIDKPHPGIQHFSSSVGGSASTSRADRQSSVADLLFRALDVVFSPQASGGAHGTARAGPPWRAAAFAKRLLARMPGSLDDILMAEADAQSVLYASRDFAEGRAAFLGKRKPSFTGS